MTGGASDDEEQRHVTAALRVDGVETGLTPSSSTQWRA
jgi:hypothetical protein